MKPKVADLTPCPLVQVTQKQINWVHDRNPSTQRTEDSLGYIARLSLKQTKIRTKTKLSNPGPLD